jgi:hypothetical protein
MTTKEQLPLPLIARTHAETVISQRAKDGYINATAMCKAANKLFNDYSRLSTTEAFVKELGAVTGIPVTELIQSLRGGHPELQGTWVHPQVAIHLAQWLSPQFAVQVTQWVFEWISGGPKIIERLPYHLRRYVANMSAIPRTHFSMLQELTYGLIAPMEAQGYTLPDYMVPDISQGRMFSKWLREEKDIDPDTFLTYRHRYEDGRVFLSVATRISKNAILRRSPTCRHCCRLLTNPKTRRPDAGIPPPARGTTKMPELNGRREETCRNFITDAVMKYWKRNPTLTHQEVALALIECTAMVTGNIKCPECRRLAADHGKTSLGMFMETALDIAAKDDAGHAGHIH